MNEETLLQLELSLIANESLMTALVAKWHGKSNGIAEDIYNIASSIYKQNKGHTKFNKKDNLIERFCP